MRPPFAAFLALLAVLAYRLLAPPLARAGAA